MGYSRHRVYDDWLDLMTYALQRDDENYLEVLDRYDNDGEQGEREADHFSYAFGLLQEGMDEVGHDLLGVVYEEMGHSSDAFGQHFTPHNLCDTKAEMILSDVDEDRDEPYTVQDPASGSGRLLISAAKKLPDTVDAEFYGVDKDSTCAKMTALNLTFFNMDGYAVQGDSLTMDYRRVWQTRGSPLGGELVELEDDEWDNPYDQEPDDVDETSGTAEVDLVPDSEEQEEDESEVVDFEELRETTLSDFSEGEKQ